MKIRKIKMAGGGGGVFMRVVLQNAYKYTYKKRNDKVSYPRTRH